jgi:hypothetical protein
VKKLYAFIILCSLILTTSCSIITVSYDYDLEANFTRLRTFDWLPDPIKAQANELNVNHIKRAVNKELEAKGIKRNPANPAFLIALHVVEESTVKIIDWGYTYGPARSFYSQDRLYRRLPSKRYWKKTAKYKGNRRFEKVEFFKGTLILDLVDANSKELIWRGAAQSYIDPDQTSEKRREENQKIVAIILANFPPIPK